MRPSVPCRSHEIEVARAQALAEADQHDLALGFRAIRRHHHIRADRRPGDLTSVRLTGDVDLPVVLALLKVIDADAPEGVSSSAFRTRKFKVLSSMALR